MKINFKNYDEKLNYGMSLVFNKKYLEAKKIFKYLTVTDSTRYEGYLNLSNIESNYILVSSKTALNAFIKFIKKSSSYKKTVLVIPNERLIEGIEDNPFHDVIIIANNSSAKTYIEKIQEHDK